jgi:hypothetical protein
MINSFGYPDLSLSIGVRAFGLGSRLQTLASEKVVIAKGKSETWPPLD